MFVSLAVLYIDFKNRISTYCLKVTLALGDLDFYIQKYSRESFKNSNKLIAHNGYAMKSKQKRAWFC